MNKFSLSVLDVLRDFMRVLTMPIKELKVMSRCAICILRSVNVMKEN